MTLAYNGDRLASTVAIPTIDDVNGPNNLILVPLCIIYRLNYSLCTDTILDKIHEDVSRELSQKGHII